jgi:hypothetical protein
LKNLFFIMLAASALNLSLYSEILSPEATRLSGKQKIFC